MDHAGASAQPGREHEHEHQRRRRRSSRRRRRRRRARHRAAAGHGPVGGDAAELAFALAAFAFALAAFAFAFAFALALALAFAFALAGAAVVGGVGLAVVEGLAGSAVNSWRCLKSGPAYQYGPAQKSGLPSRLKSATCAPSDQKTSVICVRENFGVAGAARVWATPTTTSATAEERNR